MSNLSFDDGELAGSNYLGEGTHVVSISGIKPGVSKTKNTPQIEVEFTSASGKTARDWFVTQGNKFKLAALALACGFTKEQLKAGQFQPAMLAGKRLKMVKEITGKTDDGKNKYEQSYLPAEGSAPSATNDEIPF